MAHTLNITSAAFTTINLTAGNRRLLGYVPGSSSGPTITETIEVIFEEVTIPDFMAAVRLIEQAIRLAERRADKRRGERVYLNFQPTNAAAEYRAEIVRERPGVPAGMVVYPPETLSWPWGTYKIRAQIILTRVNEWTASAETELSLANGGGSGAGGRVIYNYHTAAVIGPIITISFTAPDTITDAGAGFGGLVAGGVISLRGSTINDGIYTLATVAAGVITVNEGTIQNEIAGDNVSIYDIQNYVDIAAASIDGDLPAPIRIEFTNTDAVTLETLWMGLANIGDPWAFAHILEIGDSDTGVDAPDATSSSGIKRQYAIGAANAKVTAWTVPSATLDAAAAGLFRLITRFAAATAITEVRWSFKLTYLGSTLWESGQVLFDDTYAAISRIVREIDTVQLPPDDLQGLTPTDLTLELWAVRTGAAVTVDIDCVAPVPLDSFRRIRSIDGVLQNSILIDDGILGTVYQSVSGEIVKDLAVSGKPLLLWPNADHRIIFLQHALTANTAAHDRSASVRIYYRPRKSAL